jgi:hypothetical protein
MGMGGQSHASAALPRGKNRYPLYRRLSWPHSRSERVRKISAPPEFDPRTAHPVASRYTDWAIPAHQEGGYSVEMSMSYARRFSVMLLKMISALPLDGLHLNARTMPSGMSWLCAAIGSWTSSPLPQFSHFLRLHMLTYTYLTFA